MTDSRRAPPLDTSPELQRARGGRPKKPETEKITTRAREIMERDGVGFQKAKRRAWREIHPEWAAKGSPVSPKVLKDYIRSRVPDLIDETIDIALDPKHPRQMDALKTMLEQGIGKPTQPMEHTDGDGKPLALQVTFVKPE